MFAIELRKGMHSHCEGKADPKIHFVSAKRVIADKIKKVFKRLKRDIFCGCFWACFLNVFHFPFHLFSSFPL